MQRMILYYCWLILQLTSILLYSGWLQTCWGLMRKGFGWPLTPHSSLCCNTTNLYFANFIFSLKVFGNIRDCAAVCLLWSNYTAFDNIGNIRGYAAVLMFVTWGVLVTCRILFLVCLFVPFCTINRRISKMTNTAVFLTCLFKEANLLYCLL